MYTQKITHKLQWEIIEIKSHLLSYSRQFFNSLGSKECPVQLITNAPYPSIWKKSIEGELTFEESPNFFLKEQQNLPPNVSLVESSQTFLEFFLFYSQAQSVYSIASSFRNEKQDGDHLNEFLHIEYEGVHTQSENEKIMIDLIRQVTKNLIEKSSNLLSYFITPQEIERIYNQVIIKQPKFISYYEAVKNLYGPRAINNWNEVCLTSNDERELANQYQSLVIIQKYPIEQSAFYQDSIYNEYGVNVCENSDLIFPTYREIIGSGQRITTFEKFNERIKLEKFRHFDFSPYQEYFAIRRDPKYMVTSGFGLGAERFLKAFLGISDIQQISYKF